MSLPVHPSWAEPLAPVEDDIHQLGDFLRAQPAYLPAGNDILRAFQDPVSYTHLTLPTNREV